MAADLGKHQFMHDRDDMRAEQVGMPRDTEAGYFVKGLNLRQLLSLLCWNLIFHMSIGILGLYPHGQYPRTTYPASILVKKALYSSVQHNT